MKYYLTDIIPRIKKYSATLDQSSFLIDKPWVVSSGKSGVYEKLIFRRDGRVHFSTDGDVTDGTWEYLPEAQSLLIDYGNKKKLYRHQYLDEAILALKIDGADRGDESYYLLANEQVVPNLDVKHYLKKKFYRDKNKKLILLDDASEIEFEIENYNGIEQIKPDSCVKIDGSIINGGEYLYNNGLKKIIIENGVVIDIKKKVQYQNNINVWISNQIPIVGDKVEGIENGSFKINSGGKYTVVVSNGVVSNVKTGLYEKSTYFLAWILAIISVIIIGTMIILGI